MKKLESPHVEVGQVWEDCDKRMEGRRIKIHSIEGEYAICRKLEALGFSLRTTRIRLDRFRPTSTGFRLVE